jgi:hypothetical protein
MFLRDKKAVPRGRSEQAACEISWVQWGPPPPFPAACCASPQTQLTVFYSLSPLRMFHVEWSKEEGRKDLYAYHRT